MSSTQHTPAPWTVNRGGADLDNPKLFIDHPTGKYSDPVATCYTATPESEANARLIAAAPELLKAGERCLMALAANGAPNCEAAKEMRDAIAKATGGDNAGA